tara:strand:- start:444 stop:1169 length:726 start_codon:yes stop_codon:yes gene_type:complete
MLENNNYNVREITEPYPIWIVDNFLKDSVVKKIKKNWPPLDSNIWHNGYSKINGEENVLEQGMMAISKLDLMPNYLVDVFNYLYSNEFIKKIEEITNKKHLVHDEMNWSGLRCMVENSFQLIHSDAIRHPKNNLKKEVTCLLYINDNYNRDRDEGCLEIWNDDMTEKIHEIEPINNRLLIFLNSETSHHGVPKVLSKRKSVLFNYCSLDVNKTKRAKALFKGRPSDSKKISEIGLLRSKIK